MGFCYTLFLSRHIYVRHMCYDKNNLFKEEGVRSNEGSDPASNSEPVVFAKTVK